MHNWYECKVTYVKTLETTGTNKKVTEAYLVDAMSFTEAERRIIEEMTPYITGEFEVSAVRKARISEMFVDPQGDRWYRCKVNFITLDEKSGAEKRSASVMFVQAGDFAAALHNLTEGMKGTMSDWEVSAITETSIMDVYGVEAQSDPA